MVITKIMLLHQKSKIVRLEKEERKIRAQLRSVNASKTSTKKVNCLKQNQKTSKIERNIHYPSTIFYKTTSYLELFQIFVIC